jgi:hypothetical protein
MANLIEVAQQSTAIKPSRLKRMLTSMIDQQSSVVNGRWVISPETSQQRSH